jgi:hypothetical protein
MNRPTWTPLTTKKSTVGKPSLIAKRARIQRMDLQDHTAVQCSRAFEGYLQGALGETARAWTTGSESGRVRACARRVTPMLTWRTSRHAWVASLSSGTIIL